MSQEATAIADCSSDSPQSLRDNVRQQLNRDVESFLKKGGNVQKIEKNVRTDQPKRPNTTYGSTPI